MAKTRPLLINNGRIIDPLNKRDETGAILVMDGKITWIGQGEPDTPDIDYSILDAAGMCVCPGFIDMHCHLRQPGFENKETIATGTRAAARGGFTTVCCMPNTRPPIDTVDYVNYVMLKAELEGVVRVLPIGCITRGRNGRELADMAELAAAGAIGFSDDGSPVMNSQLMREALENSVSLGIPVIDHCEDENLARDGQVNEGEASDRLGFKGIPAIAEEIMIVRDLALASLTGGRLHIAHVSTEGSVEIIRQAKEKGVRVTAEVTPHHLTLTEECIRSYDASTKVNPPLRSPQDVEALIRGLKENVIDIIATDHAPHADADKLCDFTDAAFGISGMETAFGSLMSLVHGGAIDLPTLVAKLTCEPARIIGHKHGKSGVLEAGIAADITILDPTREWVVDVAQFASKGRNSPLAGTTLKGKVMATIAQGKLVYRDDTVKLIEMKGEK